MFAPLNPEQFADKLETLEPGEILINRDTLTNGARVTVVCADCGILTSVTFTPEMVEELHDLVNRPRPQNPIA